jgi:hypothetical protein
MIFTAAVLVTILTIAAISTIVQSVDGKAFLPSNFAKAPITTSGDKIYVSWWDNMTGNNEVMFRASTDGGKTFGDKMNLSNSTNAESQDVQINASGDRVFVTWWERNATSNEPLLRTSTDKGATFGPVMKLSTNGSIGQSSGE